MKNHGNLGQWWKSLNPWARGWGTFYVLALAMSLAIALDCDDEGLPVHTAASLLLPFGVGMAIIAKLYQAERLMSTADALFYGCATSVLAVPVIVLLGMALHALVGPSAFAWWHWLGTHFGW
jgi:hypothetical protein